MTTNCRDTIDHVNESQPNLQPRWCARWLGVLLALSASVSLSTADAAPRSFEEAKILSRQSVYFDRNTVGDLYCGCEWTWVGRSGGRVDFASCGYEVRAQPTRAIRTEFEHVVPASSFGRARQCWQNGGRQNCKRTDPVFNAMEADLHNLSVAVGEINADRSNYRFGVLPGTPLQHGACPFRVDFAGRVAEPRDEVKGKVARVNFYFAQRYNLRLSDQQERLFLAWDRAFPPSAWELERDRRIARVMGWNNPYVTGERTWVAGRGVTRAPPQSPPVAHAEARPAQPAARGQVRGNRRSRIYHLPSVCPSYDQISPANIVPFNSVAEAEAAGFRRAGNCRS